MELPTLDLPRHPLRLELRDGIDYVHCPVRRKWLVLTPEEWVRQHVVAYLHHDLGYPIALMRTERRVEGGQRMQRADIIVHGRDGRPLMLVECKAPDEPIDSETLFQAARYNRHIGAGFILLSNGIVHQCCRIEGGAVSYLDAVPLYADISIK